MQTTKTPTHIAKGYPIISMGCKGRIEAGAHKNITGIGTTRLKTCLGVVVMGNKKISLTHATVYNTPDNLLEEIKWVGEPCQVIFVKNDEVIKKELEFYKKLDRSSQLDKASENKEAIYPTDFIKNWEALLQSHYPKVKKQVINTPTGELYISLAGQISTENSPKNPIVVLTDPADNNFWGAINYLNWVYSGKTDHLACLEFDRNQRLEMPELSLKVRAILTNIKSDLKDKSVNPQTIDLSLKKFEEKVRTNGKQIEMLEESFVRPNVIKTIATILDRTAFRAPAAKPSAFLAYVDTYRVSHFDPIKQKLITDAGGTIEKEEKEKKSVLIKIQSEKLNKAFREKLGIERVCITTTANIEKKQHDYLSSKGITIEPTTHANKFFATFPAEKKKLVETVVKYSSALFSQKKDAKKFVSVRMLQRRWREKHPVQSNSQTTQRTIR